MSALITAHDSQYDDRLATQRIAKELALRLLRARVRTFLRSI